MNKELEEGMSAQIIRVAIQRNRDGWYVATSDDLPGLYVAHIDAAEVFADVPETIKALYLADGIEVQVIDGAYRRGIDEDKGYLPWITIPTHIANAELNSC